MIGSYQAFKHQAADVRIGLDFARPLVQGAALSFDTVDRARDVSAAKVAVSDAAYAAARTALQLHGAIGYTAEYDLSLWLLKVRALVAAWGTHVLPPRPRPRRGDRSRLMEMRWSEEQVELASMLGTLLARQSDSAAVRRAVESPTGHDPALWGTLCEQVGVAALMVPEAYDGAGFGFAEVAVVLEQLGRFLTPSPLLSVALGTEALLLSGDEAACARLLPEAAAGARLVTLAWDGVFGMVDAGTAVRAEGDRLTGELHHVLDGDTADTLLVVATTEGGLGLFEVSGDADGLTRRHATTMDQTLRIGSMDLDAVEATRVGGALEDLLPRLHAVGSAAVAAMQVGVAQRGLDMTVAYSKERVQFGRPIGSFQALKHRMADMLVLVETARSAAMAAALAVAAAAPDASRRSSVAKAWCSEALDQVADETIQLHGGIAITWEHDAHLVFKRAHSLGQALRPGAPAPRPRPPLRRPSCWVETPIVLVATGTNGV